MRFPSGIPPAPRCDHAAAVVGDRIFIFGGCGGEAVFFNDVVVFDTNTLSWRHPRVHGRPPAPRGSVSFVSHRDKDIYLFGVDYVVVVVVVVVAVVVVAVAAAISCDMIALTAGIALIPMVRVVVGSACPSIRVLPCISTIVGGSSVVVVV